MSESFDPNSFAHKLDANHRQWIQSVQSVVNGQIEIGTPEQNSPFATSGVNQGVPTQYKRANGSGVMIRIDAAGVTAGATYNWCRNTDQARTPESADWVSCCGSGWRDYSV